MIVKPENMDFSNKNIIMIISGLPGVGKTTLALSAPDVVLVDTDEGMARVKPEHRKDTSLCKTYEELIADIKAFAGRYKTVVIDTGGSLISLMKEWVIRNNPQASKKSGGFSQTGFGDIKTEFIRLSYELQKNFNVIYLFHVTKDKQNEEVVYDLDAEGSAKNIVWKPIDLGAYMHIINGERYLGFTPTMNYNAKSAYGIKGLVKVPELKDGDKNDFLTRLFEQVKANISAESASLKPQREAYEKAIDAGVAIINMVDAPEKVMTAGAELKALKHALTSEAELKAALSNFVKSKGWVYDKATKQYTEKPKGDESLL